MTRHGPFDRKNGGLHISRSESRRSVDIAAAGRAVEYDYVPRDTCCLLRTALLLLAQSPWSKARRCLRPSENLMSAWPLRAIRPLRRSQRRNGHTRRVLRAVGPTSWGPATGTISESVDSKLGVASGDNLGSQRTGTNIVFPFNRSTIPRRSRTRGNEHCLRRPSRDLHRRSIGGKERCSKPINRATSGRRTCASYY